MATPFSGLTETGSPEKPGKTARKFSGCTEKKEVFNLILPENSRIKPRLTRKNRITKNPELFNRIRPELSQLKRKKRLDFPDLRCRLNRVPIADNNYQVLKRAN